MGKKSGTTVQSYTPTAEEVRLQKQAADYSEAVAPNALWLNTTARDVLEGGLGTVQADFNQLNQTAQNQIGQAQQGVAGLTAGGLEGYNQQMQQALQRGMNNVMGSTLNSLSQRNVLNSSVTNQAMNDMSKSVSDTMAEQYSNNVGILNGLYGQQAQLANAPITTVAGAQEAAQAPSLALWNASLGLDGATTSTLGALAGQGTTTTTGPTGGSGVLGGLFGLGSAAITACFTEDTDINMADGTTKKIKDVKVGDELVCFDRLKEDVQIENAIAIESTDSQPIYEVVATKGEKTIKLKTTLSQPLLTEENRFIDVGIMKIGTILKGGYKVKKFINKPREKVYDIKTNGCNCYYANGIVAYGVF